METKIRITAFDTAEAMYSPKYNKPHEYNKKLVVEDREHWLGKHADIEANFDVLRGLSDYTRFFEFMVDGEAVSHFVIQFFSPKKSYISWVYTMKDFRGSQLTQEFLYRVISQYQKAGFKGKFGLRVEKDNQAMCHLVEKLGFVKGETDIAVLKISDEEDEYEYILTGEVRG